MVKNSVPKYSSYEERRLMLQKKYICIQKIIAASVVGNNKKVQVKE